MLNRSIQPKMGVAAYETFSVSQKTDTQVRTACEDAGCEAWANGWETVVDESTELGRAQASYIRNQSMRTRREMRSGDLTVFRFEPHQRCFSEHKTMPQRWTRRHGDFRGNPSGNGRVFDRPDQWVDEFATHQEEIADLVRRG